tara:strand:- start:273 stop:470 length:198 start_codon:yes stop_codon:yes gene_type:complete
MGKYKIESYNSRSRLINKKKSIDIENLRLKNIELNLLKELTIKEYVENKKNKKSITDKVLGIFKK